jgi:hypothetical protein
VGELDSHCFKLESSPGIPSSVQQNNRRDGAGRETGKPARLIIPTVITECDPPAYESEHRAHLWLSRGRCFTFLLLSCGKRKLLAAAAAMADPLHSHSCAIQHHRAFHQPIYRR